MAEEEYFRCLPWGQEPSRARPGGCGFFSGSGPLRGLSLARAFLGWVFLVLAGCGPPDPPEGLLVALDAVPIRAEAPARGLAYYHLRNETEPWDLHLLRVDLGRCELGLEVLEAPVPEGSSPGRSRVSELAEFSGDGVIGAVNGDFFTPEGLPVGTEVVWGQVRQVRNRPALAWFPGRPPWMGLPRALGDSALSVGWDVPRSVGDGATQVLGGFPLILQAGARVGDLGVGDRPSFAADRHPRTAVGYDSDKGFLWLLVVDGRQPGHSDGMTLPELASAMETLGIEEGLNLDGGGSTVMVLQGEAVSRPSDAQGERPVVNALAVRRDRAFCRR